MFMIHKLNSTLTDSFFYFFIYLLFIYATLNTYFEQKCSYNLLDIIT